MSLTSKQIDELRTYAKDRKGELAKLINDAADTIEMLSAKLSAANMERSSQYYHGGWIPCSERLPEDEYVLISKKPSKISGSEWCVAIAIRTADPRSRKIQWRDSGFGVIQDDKVLAWMPLPEPYKEKNDE